MNISADTTTFCTYFTQEELTCKCGCGYCPAHIMLQVYLDDIRHRVGRPLTLSSACRCPKHNRNEGGKPDSAHVSGLAADIKYSGSAERFEILDALFFLGVKRIGIAKTFIHFDLDDTKPPKVAWLY